jgi:MYXO-CTERM domain-containing protein
MRPILPLSAFLAATLAPAVAGAFCGFYVSGEDTKLYNNATQVVLMRDGTRTVLSMQNNYQGPPKDFAMVVPVPVVLQKENVKTLPMNVFDKIDNLDSPRLVEYWEQDPCYEPPETKYQMQPAATPVPSAMGGPANSLGVKIEAQFAVGEYEVVILSAQDSTGLDTWLRQQKYNIPQGAEPYLRPYVQSGSKFFVAKVDTKKVKFDGQGMAMLSPLRFHYDSTEFSLPVRLGLINAKDAQDLIVHILARGQRYEVANYANVTIPTNLDVGEETKGKFASFYAALFDATLEKNPKAVVTEYAWDASTCDPCPGPALDASDIATFGGDVIPTLAQQGAWGFTLTRLHARYDKNALGEDLVFKAAPPIVGGREVPGENGKLEHGSRPHRINNFQGRYAIRHPWTGPIACKNPRRGIWGGPPANLAAANPPMAARNLAFAPRGNIALASFVKSDVPELSITPQSGSRAAGETPPSTPRGRGCAGCAMSGAHAAPIGLLAVVVFLLRRRKR